MSQPLNQNSNDYFNNIQNTYPHSQPINNNINQMLNDSSQIQNNNFINNEKSDNYDFIYECCYKYF